MPPLAWLTHEIAFELSAVAHAVAAIAVTLHALLHKRDVRSAIGWIGLAWLSPVLGALLYYAFGINRVKRRATRVGRLIAARRGSPQLEASKVDLAGLDETAAAIAHVGTATTGRPLVAGNALVTLRGGDEAYPAMLEAIRGARRTIALASYIFRPDTVGLAFVDALEEARGRGVQVRALLDGVGSGYVYSGARRLLRGAGVRVAPFMHDWMPWRMPFVNMRTHKKLLIADGRIGFTGGLNIGAENMTGEAAPLRVQDAHFRVEGPVVRQLMAAFADDWSFTTRELLEGDGWWPELEPVGGVPARGISSGPDEDRNSLETVLGAAVGAAKRRLRIVTPYFLPNERLMADVATAALRGVEVELVMPARSNHAVIDWAMRAHLGFFPVPGLRWHQTPPPFDHSKLVTVDGCWALVGSANWDLRSLRLNFEFSMEVYGQTVVAEIDRLIDGKVALAQAGDVAGLGRRRLPIRLRDATARLMLPYL